MFSQIDSYFSCRRGVQDVDYYFVIWRGGRVAEGNGLLNRRTGISPYRGFESRPLRWFLVVFETAWNWG